MGIHPKAGYNYGSSISPRYEPRSRAEYSVAESIEKTSLPPNPDPYNFRIIMEKLVGEYLVAWILYPDATNYEGLKILLLKNTTTLKNEKSVDPHFFEGGNLISRFVPDQEGWEFAIKVAGLLVKNTHGLDYKD